MCNDLMGLGSAEGSVCGIILESLGTGYVFEFALVNLPMPLYITLGF
jgi:hypothetical protein